MKPFYQGKIDSFCAIYAVLNALRLTHGIRIEKARGIFNDILMKLATEPFLLKGVLEQTTDYFFLVDAMLTQCAANMPLCVERPFSGDDRTSVNDFWQNCEKWINAGNNRTAIFRFLRYMQPESPPLVRHWTTIETIGSESLHLYDSSHDADAIMNLKKTDFVTNEKAISKDKLFYVQPSSLRLLRLPF
ncbi:MAG: hypothetical protein IK079_02705 [Desulfovibrio sp.]|nr:hypothetical protein [Desulfovibrio sp.]